MNILNLLIKEKHIAGIEISENAIRIAYFLPKRKFSKKIKTGGIDKELMLTEEPISVNTIKDGVVVDKEFLGKILKDIWNKSKLGKNYAIVSIPEAKVYSRIFPFPKTADETQLKDAIDLAINFQLPLNREDIYVGSENAGDSNLINEVLISAVPKNIVDDYVYALNYAGIKVLAIESHVASIARSVKLKFNQTTLLTKINTGGATIFILKDGSMRFTRTYSENIIKSQDFIKNEALHIKESFESEKKATIIDLPFTEARIKDEYMVHPELGEMKSELQYKWLIAMGALIRGQIPKGKDNRISLL